MFRFYKSLLTRYPIGSQAIQTGMLMATGDLISQTLVERHSLRDVELKRTMEFFTIGTVFVGPSLTVWYRFLYRYVGGSGGKSVMLKKVALDQILFAPICLACFLAAVSTVQGHGLEETKRHVRHNYRDVLTANYTIWPWVQMGNFYLVPLQYQVLTVQVVAIFWNAYLSYKTRPDQESKDW